MHNTAGFLGNFNAQVGQQTHRGADVIELRHIAQRHGFGREQRGAQDGQCRILGARNADFAVQASPADNFEFIHACGTLRGSTFSLKAREFLLSFFRPALRTPPGAAQ